MYLFIDKHHIKKYDGEPIKIVVGGKTVKVIVNPTEDDLRMVGYKNLEISNPPEEKEGFYITQYYVDKENSIGIEYE